MSWLMLVRKELRQNGSLAGLGGVLFFIILVFLIYQVNTNPGNTIFIFMLIPIILLHFFYMFLMILASMRREWKEGTVILWLNIPLRGWNLLSAKVTASFIYFIISLIITMASFYGLLYYSREIYFQMGIPDFSSLFLEYSGWLFLFIVNGALWLGLTGLFIFVVSKVIKPLGWLIAIGITVGLNFLWSWITNTAAYETIAHWETLLTFDQIAEGLNMDIEGSPLDHLEGLEILHLGHMLIEVGLMVAIFIGICWLFDKKVEV
ncbi:hypothetical protein [Alteribacter aurantiacus]|uniref:hypothetical protein n=1 Tax=Alteribacter aurantiacus TaxID=254410 RepID=UPI0004009446|nr:hypothetical protein [Alteribacter aurantiacus]